MNHRRTGTARRGTALVDATLTTVAGALAATVGVVAGALLSRTTQHRHWLRDQQLAAYVDLLGHYARFTMVLNRAHADRTGWDYDWARWSAALVTASLVAPREVADELDTFAAAVGEFLDAAAGDPTKLRLSTEEFGRANAGAARAQIDLVNAIRRSLGRGHGEIAFALGGSLGRAADRP
jgi:hypothetical protein